MTTAWARGVCVAIDGPAGVGKTTTAMGISERLGLVYVDTGAMYRAMGVEALRLGLSPDDRESCEELARSADINLKYDATHGLQVLINNRDVTSEIRTPQASDAASRISVHPGVRSRMVEWQRSLADRGGVVMEGRDIGTVVLPRAQAKIFLTASVEERARRRLGDLQASGGRSTLEAVIRDVQERDARDQGREVAPLRPATDAVVLECTALTLDEQIARVLTIIETRVRLSED